MIFKFLVNQIIKSDNDLEIFQNVNDVKNSLIKK